MRCASCGYTNRGGPLNCDMCGVLLDRDAPPGPSVGRRPAARGGRDRGSSRGRGRARDGAGLAAGTPARRATPSAGPVRRDRPPAPPPAARGGAPFEVVTGGTVRYPALCVCCAASSPSQSFAEISTLRNVRTTMTGRMEVETTSFSGIPICGACMRHQRWEMGGWLLGGVVASVVCLGLMLGQVPQWWHFALFPVLLIGIKVLVSVLFGKRGQRCVRGHSVKVHGPDPEGLFRWVFTNSAVGQAFEDAN